MPLYEYECPDHGRFDNIEPMRAEVSPGYRYAAFCPAPECKHFCTAVISLTHWYRGFKFLKEKSEKSPPAPTDSGYHKEWDEAYGN